ncbi:arachidonate 5-lipoxygenase-like protein [Labeo rohita]|uniref:Arachidonate 5-lipoxygenase-like protein n=1 Tax=Labeo rohita TaxID=84645 RepID=A0A498LVN0_LABRO|nr:arachidonate 5-lipoxygenase-like protein [Labeo rohita]
MMDAVKEMPIHSAVDLQGAVLGRHEEEIFATRHAVESLAAQITDLTNQLRHLQSQSPSLEPRTTSEPRINNPPCYSERQLRIQNRLLFLLFRWSLCSCLPCKSQYSSVDRKYIHFSVSKQPATAKELTEETSGLEMEKLA